jgi:hypothetical protein
MLGIGLDRGLRGEGSMGRQRYTAEQIISELRDAEVALAQGHTAIEVVRPRHYRADGLPLATGIWGAEGGTGQAAERP